MPRFTLITLFIFSFIAVNNAFALDVMDEFPKGSINWSRGIVTAVGYGVPPATAVHDAQARLLAERAATGDARRNLLEIVGEVRVDAVSTVGTLMTKKDVIMTRVSGIVKGSVVTGRRFLNDGSVEVTVEMPVTGAFLDVMLTEIKPVPSITMYVPVPGKKKKDIKGLEVKIPVTPVEDKKQVTEPSRPDVPVEPLKPAEPFKTTQEEDRTDLTRINYSGLIIDARDTDVKPALMPKVIDEKGKVIYSSANMQKEDAVKTGVVGYAKEVDAARKHPRVTETPVVLAALRESGEKKSDVVISNRDAESITTTEPALGYLKKGRVMIVYR